MDKLQVVYPKIVVDPKVERNSNLIKMFFSATT